MSQSQGVGTGVIHHTHERGTTSFPIQSAEDSADRVTKLCYGSNHLILLKSRSIQPISSNDSLSDAYPLLQKLNCETSLIDIAFGIDHGVALDSKHRVFTFGDNTYGQLGIGSISTRHSPNGSMEPVLVRYFEKVNQAIIQIACGSHHSVALSKSGHVYSWGDGRRGQLGTKVMSLQILPRCIPHLPPTHSIACGPENTVAVSRMGTMYLWGDGKSIPSKVDVRKDIVDIVDTVDSECEDVENTVNLPNSKEDTKTLKVRQVAVGMTHSLCVTECGSLFGWGLSSSGQLGTIQTKKSITTPTPITDFEGDRDHRIVGIECFGQCSVVHTERDGLYFMGFNNALFDGKMHRVPFHLEFGTFGTQRVERFGCSRRDFVVLTATTISTVSPSIVVAQGTEIVIRGHGIYRTPHTPMVRFVLNSGSNDVITLINEARFVEHDENEEELCLVACSPDLTERALTFPLTAQMAIAVDGTHFSDPHELCIIGGPGPNDTFEIEPQCGDQEGNVKCFISSSTGYFSGDFVLEDIKVRFVGTEQDSEHILSAELNKERQIECTTPSLAGGLYKVELAMDGQRFTDIQCAFRSYKVECAECVPEIVDLSRFAEDSEDPEHGGVGTIDLEFKVNGFLPVDPSRVCLKLVSKADPMNMIRISKFVYESQSARDITASGLESKNEFERQRKEFRDQEKEELSALKETQKAEDDEHEQRVAKLEKEKKKKKKPADVEAWEAEFKQETDQWEETLKEHAKARREITRKFKRQIMLLDKRESEVPKRDEADPNGEGYIRCKVDTADLKGWTLPSDVQAMITLNGMLFSDLCSMQCIHPRIKQISPRLGSLSDSTKIKIIVEGFDMKEAEATDFKVSVQDTPEEEKVVDQIEVLRDEAGQTIIAVDVEGLTVVGEKMVTLKYGDLFQIPCAFSVHDAVKITAVTPKEVGVDGAGNLTVLFSGDIDGKFVDQVFVRIAANEKTVVLKGVLSEDGGGIEARWDGEESSLESVGAAKKAQVEISFNEQQWITAKMAVCIK